MSLLDENVLVWQVGLWCRQGVAACRGEFLEVFLVIFLIFMYINGRCFTKEGQMKNSKHADHSVSPTVIALTAAFLSLPAGIAGAYTYGPEIGSKFSDAVQAAVEPLAKGVRSAADSVNRVDLQGSHPARNF